MFSFLCVMAGAATGCGVCAFGMWAFLKGQSAAILVKMGGLPIRSRAETDASPSIARQLGEMFKTERGE
jgi:hypothetical protein